MAAPAKSAYAIAKRFEATVAFLSATSPDFFHSIAESVEPDAFPTPSAKLVMRAVKAHFVAHGRGPSNASVVFQHLRAEREAGKVTIEEIAEADEYLEKVALSPPKSDVDFRSGMAAVIQERLRRRMAQRLASSAPSKEAFAEVAKIAEVAGRAGAADTSTGWGYEVSLAAASSSEVAEKLPTGISQLDAILTGGLPLGALGVFAGASGDGKSMALTQVYGCALMHGKNAVYATLELAESVVAQRLYANITNVEIDHLANGGRDAAHERFRKLQPILGTMRIKAFNPLETTVAHFRAWVEQVEQETGKRVEVVVIDYADKLIARSHGKDKDGTYQQMKIVYESLRTWFLEENRWGWTASQVNRAGYGSKRKNLGHMSDSMQKVFLSHVMIMLNVYDGQDTVEMCVEKYSTGVRNGTTGPLSTEFKLGRIAARSALPEEEEWWYR